MSRKLEIVIRGKPKSGKSVVLSMVHYLLQGIGEYNIAIEDGKKTPEEIAKTYRQVLFTKDMCGKDNMKKFFRDIDIRLKTEEVDV
jgi:hypothetical protein